MKTWPPTSPYGGTTPGTGRNMWKPLFCTCAVLTIMASMDALPDEESNVSEPVNCAFVNMSDQMAGKLIEHRRMAIKDCDVTSAVCRLALHEQRQGFVKLANPDLVELMKYRRDDAACGTLYVGLTLALSEMAKLTLAEFDVRYPSIKSLTADEN